MREVVLVCVDCGYSDQVLERPAADLPHGARVIDVCPSCDDETEHAAFSLDHEGWPERQTAEVDEWRRDVVPLAEPFDQVAHVTNEASELLDHYVKDKQYEDYSVSDDELRKEAGDIVVALCSLLAMEDMTLREAVEAARAKNEDRDWDDHKAGDA